MADLWDEDWSEEKKAKGRTRFPMGRLLFLALLIGGAVWWTTSRIKTQEAAAAPLPAILEDLARWDAASEAVQDQAIVAIADRLKRAYVFVDTQVYRCGEAAHRIARFRHERLGIELMLLPGGRYQMGEDAGQKDEKPAHPVKIRRAFLLGRIELRQVEWDAVGGEDQRYQRGPELPIEGFSWHRAQAWLEKAGDGLRLPSESEWEYACRAGTQTRFFWGETMDERYAWYRENAGFKTHPATEHETVPNAFGLIDMVGNVEEFCQDGYFFDYAGGPRDERALSTADVPRRDARRFLRAGRGGDWNSREDPCRSASRNALSRNRGDKNLGLRVALSLP